ncbi:MAG: hypothetical protein ACREL5_05235 [Gemmatimonadales bacterium]
MRFRIMLGLAMVFPAALLAQSRGHGSDASIGVRVGTLGIGGEIAKLVTPHIGVRASANFFSYNRNVDNNDVSFDAKLKLQAITGLIDLFPGNRGSFHLSAGIMTRPMKLTGTGVPKNGTFTFNGTEYSSAQVGTLTGTGQWGSALPYIGIGFGTPAAKHSGIGFKFDLGAGVGKPSVTLTASGATSGSQLQSDLNAQIAKTQKDANKVFAYPVLELGLVYKF